MYSTANESRQSDNARNISAELQHFLTDQSDSNVISQDYIFAFKRRETPTPIPIEIANKNKTQRSYRQKNNTKI